MYRVACNKKAGIQTLSLSSLLLLFEDDNSTLHKKGESKKCRREVTYVLRLRTFETLWTCTFETSYF